MAEHLGKCSQRPWGKLSNACHRAMIDDRRAVWRSALTIIPECWQFVSAAGLSQSVRSGQTPSPSVYVDASCTDATWHPCGTAAISISVGAQLRLLAGKSLHHIRSINLSAVHEHPVPAKLLPSGAGERRDLIHAMRQFAIRWCTSRPCASEKTLSSFGGYGERTQRTARNLATAVKTNTPRGILFPTKFHVACQIHQPLNTAYGFLKTASSSSERIPQVGLLWADRLSTRRSHRCADPRPLTSAVSGRY
jgi:hypothetical protein